MFTHYYTVPDTLGHVCCFRYIARLFLDKQKLRNGKTQKLKRRAKVEGDSNIVTETARGAKQVHKYIPTHCRLDSAHPANDMLMDIKRSWPSPHPPPSLGTPSPLTHTLLCAEWENVTWFPSLRSCVNDNLFRQHWASLSPPPPAVPLSHTTSAQRSLQMGCAESIQPTCGNVQTGPCFPHSWKHTQHRQMQGHSCRTNAISCNKSKVRKWERAFQYMHMCACVSSSEATAQYNGTKNLSITIKREMEGSPEGEEGAAVCPESLDGMWATERRGLGSAADLWDVSDFGKWEHSIGDLFTNWAIARVTNLVKQDHYSYQAIVESQNSYDIISCSIVFQGFGLSYGNSLRPSTTFTCAK